jgi:hypothetical protein
MVSIGAATATARPDHSGRAFPYAPRNQVAGLTSVAGFPSTAAASCGTSRSSW